MRRGYALVIVVLLTVVVGLTAAVGLQRQSSESLSVARQVAAYQQHHASRGMQEAIGVWLRAVNARTVGESLGEGGHALDISLADGSTLSVYLHDGQGTALADEVLIDPLWQTLSAVEAGKVHAVSDAIWNTAGGILAARLMLDDIARIYGVE